MCAHAYMTLLHLANSFQFILFPQLLLIPNSQVYSCTYNILHAFVTHSHFKLHEVFMKIFGGKYLTNQY